MYFLILSYDVWIYEFGFNVVVIGLTVTFDMIWFVIIGVMFKGFYFFLQLGQVDLWTTTVFDFAFLSSTASLAGQRSAHYFLAIGLLKLGVSLQVV